MQCMARHWRTTMMAAVGAPEVISQLESAAKVLMVSISPLFSHLCQCAVSSVWGFTLRGSCCSSVSGESLDKRGAVRGAVLDSLHPAEAQRSHHHLHHHLHHHHNSTTLVTKLMCIMNAVSSGDVSQRPSLILQPCKSALNELKCVCWSFSISCCSYTRCWFSLMFAQAHV